MHIFIDSSVNQQTNKSYGCYLLLDSLDFVDTKEFIDFINNKIIIVELQSKTSTDAELELALYILSIVNNVSNVNKNIILYTDCNNLYNLKNREYSQKHKKAKLYDKIKTLLNNVELVKVKGHNKKEKQINNYDIIFSYVDKKARKMVRSY